MLHRMYAFVIQIFFNVDNVKTNHLNQSKPKCKTPTSEGQYMESKR